MQHEDSEEDEDGRQYRWSPMQVLTGCTHSSMHKFTSSRGRKHHQSEGGSEPHSHVMYNGITLIDATRFELRALARGSNRSLTVSQRAVSVSPGRLPLRL